MKFTVLCRSLIDPLVKVASICSNNPANPDDLSTFVSMQVKKDAITLIGTDNNVQMKATIVLSDGMCEVEGGCFIDAVKVRTFMRTLSYEGSMTVETNADSDEIVVTVGEEHYQLRIRPMDVENNEYPVFNSNAGDEAEKSLIIGKNQLHNMIVKSDFCVSRDNYRDYLKGVRIEASGNNCSIYGLDGHRMAVLDTILEEPCSQDIRASLTLRGAQELAKNLGTSEKSDSARETSKVELRFTNNFVTANIDKYEITCRILNCNYPDVRAVLPKNPEPMIGVDLQVLRNKVKSVSTFANRRLNNINLTFTSGKLTLHSQNADGEMATVTLPTDYNEPMEKPLEVNLNVDFVKDFLNAIETPSVVFGFSPPYANTMFCPKYVGGEPLVRASYIVSHIIV